MATTYTPRRGNTYDPNAAVPEIPMDQLAQPTQLERGFRASLRSAAADGAAHDYYKAAAAGDAAAAQAAGLRAQDYSQQAQTIAPRVQSVGQVNGVGDGVDYALGLVGGAPLSIAEPAVGGALGGVALGALGSRFGLRPQLAGRMAQGGGAAGAVAPMYGQFRDAAASEHYQHELQTGQRQDPNAVLSTIQERGLAQAAPYLLSPMATAPGRIAAGRSVLPQRASQLGSAVQGMAVGAGADVASTVIGQSYRDTMDPTRNRSGDMTEIADEVIGGAIVGAPFEAAGHIGQGVQRAAGAAGGMALRGGQAAAEYIAPRATEAWQNRPRSMEQAAEMAGTFAADMQNRGEDAATVLAAKRFTQDADVDALLAPQEGMGADQLMQDDAAKHTAAASFVTRLQDQSFDAPEYVRSAAAGYASGQRTQDSWKQLSDAVNDWQRSKYLEQDLNELFKGKWESGMQKAGELGADLMNAKDAAKDAYEVTRHDAGRMNAQTPYTAQDIEHGNARNVPKKTDEVFRRLLVDAIVPGLGLRTPGARASVGPVVAEGLQRWVQGGFSDPTGAVAAPRALLRLLPFEPVKTVANVTDLMYRQGLIDNAGYARRNEALQMLQQEIDLTRKVSSIARERLLPTALAQLTPAATRNLIDALIEGRLPDRVAAEAFGDRYVDVQQDLQRLGIGRERGYEDKLADLRLDSEDSGTRTTAPLDSDEQGDNAGHEELAGMTDPFTPNEVATDSKWHHYNDFTGTPYEVGGRIIDLKNVDPETGEYADKGSHEDHADGRIAELKAKNPGSSYEKVPYMDALVQRFGASKEGFGAIQAAISKIAAKHGRLSNEEINKRFFVLRESTARGGEATDVSADSFKVVDPRDKRKNVWAEHVERSAEGDIIGGTAAEGKIWLRTADGREFATSTAKIITHISEGTRREQGNAGDGRATGTAGQVDMLHQGLASMFAAGVGGEQAVDAKGNLLYKTVNGKEEPVFTEFKRALAPVIGFRKNNVSPIKWGGVNAKIPDELRMYSKTGATYGDAKRLGLDERARELSTALRKHISAASPRIKKEINAVLKASNAAVSDADRKSSLRELERLVGNFDKGTEEGKLKYADERQTVEPGTEIKGPRSLHEDRGEKVRTNEDRTGEPIGSVGGAPELLGSGMPAQKDMFKHPQDKLASHGTPSDARKARAENAAAEKKGLKPGKLPLSGETTPMHRAVIAKARDEFSATLKQYTRRIKVVSASELGGKAAMRSTENGILIAKESFSRPITWAKYGQVESNRIRLAREGGHQMDLANDRVYSSGLARTFDEAVVLYASLKPNDVLRKWLSVAFDAHEGVARSDSRQRRELFAQLVALHNFKPDLLKSRFERGFNYVEKAYAHAAKAAGDTRGKESLGEANGRVGQGDRPVAGSPEGRAGKNAEGLGRVILTKSGLYLSKDQAKSDKANKFIGEGSATSATEQYAIDWGRLANGGSYEASDRVFLSVEGARSDRLPLNTIELKKATAAGATIITDTAYHRERPYNVGEREAADFLTEQGYVETKPGEWTPGADESSSQSDGAKYNAQSAQAPTGSDPWTNAQRVKFFADIHRRLGPKIKSVLTDKLFGVDKNGKQFPISGQFLDDTISASIYATNVLQIGAHESMHALFKRLTDPGANAHRVTDLLLRAANSAPVVRQLERLLDGETNALKQIAAGAEDYAEERLAYMFQFYQAGLLKIGPETKTAFQKITDTLRAVFGVLSDDQKAEQLLKAFDQGKMPDADAAVRVLERNLEWRERQYKGAYAVIKPVTNKLHRLVGTTEMNMKRHGVKEYDEVVRLFKRAVGESGAQGFFDAKDQQTKIFTNKLANVFNGLEVKDLELAAKYLHSGEKPTDKVAMDVVAKIKGGTDSKNVKHKGILPELFDYMQRKGVQVWEVSESDPKKGEWVPVRNVANYFPRVYDMEKLSTKGADFVAALLKHNSKELEAIAAETKGRTAKDVAEAILARLTNSMGEPTLEETSSAVGFSPFAAAVNRRKLDWLSPEVIKEFGEKDVARVMTAYIVQAVKRAEYTERFGPDGSVLKAKLEAGHRTHFSNELGTKSGVDKAKLVDAMRDAAKRQDLESEAAWALVESKMSRKDFDAAYKSSLKVAGETAKDAMAMEGTLGYDVKPMVRKLNNAAVVYQNLRTLSTSIFSQVIDPMGMVARGAEMSDAWTAYKRGLREVGASFKNENIKDKDAWIAEVVGTVDATNLLAQYGQLYGSQYMGGPFRRMNEAMFKYNGMEGFNRGMQIAGTRAAVNFIKRHSQFRTKKGDDYLAELNLKADDVKVSEGGDLEYTDPKIAAAIHQWVNGAVLRPNASQRTAWGSDPNYMAFWHMKQFAYTFHDTIIKRVVHDAKKYGDAGPAAMLVATTIPLMIGTDAMKSILLTGDEPAWMNQGLDAQLHHGAMRAGLGGMFQPELDALDGNHGLIGLAGPFADQLAKIPDKTFGENVVNALPGANVLNRYAAP